MKRPSYDVYTPTIVLEDNRLPANARLIFGEIFTMTLKKGFANIQDSDFANWYRVTERTIKKYIKSLVDVGYLEIGYRENENGIKERILITKGV